MEEWLVAGEGLFMIFPKQVMTAYTDINYIWHAVVLRVQALCL